MNVYLVLSAFASRTVSTLVATEKGKQRLQSLYSVTQCVVIYRYFVQEVFQNPHGLFAKYTRQNT
jgi:hypothetical protein